MMIREVEEEVKGRENAEAVNPPRVKQDSIHYRRLNVLMTNKLYITHTRNADQIL